MSLRARLSRIEGEVPRRPAPPVWLHEDDWLDRYAEWGREGAFAREPDFPLALAEYRTAVEAARASADPPWLPPADFEPDARNPHLRLVNWRWRNFPVVRAALEWLHEMRDRAEKDVPPVTLAEYAELSTWFAAHQARLRAIEKTKPSELLPLGDGRRTHCGEVRYWLNQGPRAEGSGRVAELVRRLRQAYPEPTEGATDGPA